MINENYENEPLYLLQPLISQLESGSNRLIDKFVSNNESRENILDLLKKIVYYFHTRTTPELLEELYKNRGIMENRILAKNISDAAMELSRLNIQQVWKSIEEIAEKYRIEKKEIGIME